MKDNKSKSSSDNSTSKGKMISKHYLIYCNLGWVIAILITIIILLATVKFNLIIDGEVLMEGIVNFSTFLSIILSTSSILFAFFTSRDTSQQYSAMDKAIGEMRETHRNISANNSDLLQRVNEVSEHIVSLDSKYDIHKIVLQRGVLSTQSNPTTNIKDVDIPKNLLEKEVK